MKISRFQLISSDFDVIWSIFINFDKILAIDLFFLQSVCKKYLFTKNQLILMSFRVSLSYLRRSKLLAYFLQSVYKEYLFNENLLISADIS